MENSKITTGKASYAWNDYKKFDGTCDTLQVIEWPNGEGFTYIKSDGSTYDFEFQEWGELGKTVNALGASNICEQK